MASIRKIRNKYFSRVVWRDENGQSEKTISLKTDKKSDAIIRNNAVTKIEDSIKDGDNYSFPWLNDDGRVKLLKVSIQRILA